MHTKRTLLNEELARVKLKEHNANLELIFWNGKRKSISKFKCLVCNDTFENTLDKVLHKENVIGCPTCRSQVRKKQGKNSRKSLSDIITALKKLHISVSTEVSPTAQSILNLTCDKCSHTWKTTWEKHRGRHGCPVCNYRFSTSPISLKWIEDVSKLTGMEFQTGKTSKEKVLKGKSGKSYRVDGWCEDTNTVLEFNGDVYHGNPKMFKPDDKCHPYNNLTSKELYAKTLFKEKDLKENGYNVITIWEKDYKAGIVLI